MRHESEGGRSIQYEEEQYELTEDGRLPQPKQSYTTIYKDGSTIDWLQEEMAGRQRQQGLKSQAGVRGILSPALDAARGWLVVILTGMGVGMAGAWLDVLVKWYVIMSLRVCWMLDKLCRLGDLREGRCSYGFFYNQVACCSGIDRMSTASCFRK
jgi:chloride channel 3/4/5